MLFSILAPFHYLWKEARNNVSDPTTFAQVTDFTQLTLWSHPARAELCRPNLLPEEWEEKEPPSSSSRSWEELSTLWTLWESTERSWEEEERQSAVLTIKNRKVQFRNSQDIQE